MIRKLYIITKRWWRTTLYLKKWKPQVPLAVLNLIEQDTVRDKWKPQVPLETLNLDKWKPNEEQVLPEEITKGISLKKVPSGTRVVNIGLAKKGKK